MGLIWKKIRVKIGYDSNGKWKILRADGNYKLRDYTDLRYTEIPLNDYDVDLIIDKGKTPSQICKDTKAEIGGNCCLAWSNHGIYNPLGVIVKDQKFIQKGSMTTKKWADFILPKNNRPFIGQVLDSKDIKLAFSSTPQIVKDGNIFVNSFIEGTPNDIKNGRNPRTALGINKVRDKLIYCVVDGRSPVDTGLRTDELAAIMISLGSYEAINLDGGGSCSFVVDGKPVNYQSKYSERATSSALIFKPKKSLIKKPFKIVKDILNLYPKKYKVYISPSTQQWNIGVHGYNEEYWMHKVADKLEEILISYGLEVKVGRKEQSLTQMVAESNTWGADIHLALHSDAEDTGTARGATGFYYNGSSDGMRLTRCIYDEVSKVTPAKDRGIKPGNHLYEIRKTSAPACLIENSFHTNEKDVEYITTHYIELAEASAKGVLKFLDIKF